MKTRGLGIFAGLAAALSGGGPGEPANMSPDEKLAMKEEPWRDFRKIRNRVPASGQILKERRERKRRFLVASSKAAQLIHRHRQQCLATMGVRPSYFEAGMTVAMELKRQVAQERVADAKRRGKL